MVEVFNQGAFSSYRIEDSRYSEVLTESRSFSAGTRRPTKRTIFLSHKHDDLEDLKGFIGYLERYYTVECYIDSEDPGMPEKTSGETAERIKKFIKTTDRFILLATDNAIASKWCNWELGYGDAQKFKDRIAILPQTSETDGYQCAYPAQGAHRGLSECQRETSGLPRAVRPAIGSPVHEI